MLLLTTTQINGYIGKMFDPLIIQTYYTFESNNNNCIIIIKTKSLK